MASDSEIQVLSEVQENNLALKAVESDSDSGQGSCEMASPRDQAERMDFVENGDSDDDGEILMLRKARNKKLFEESDSDAEVATKTDPDSDKENKTSERGKACRIRSALLDSDESDKDEDKHDATDKLNIGDNSAYASPEKDTSENKRKKKSHKSPKRMDPEETQKGKSERRKNKEKKKLRSNEKLKEGNQEKSTADKEVVPLNDSGCLLADGDLYDKDEQSEEEEESLEAIRANVKGRFKSGHSQSFEDEHEEEFEEGFDKSEKRKERKAARMSKEAMKQIHSETQRLLREAAVSLPYHLPEPKSIHDFFKRRARPLCQGNAMQLIKSSKYHPCNTEDEKKETNPTDSNPRNMVEECGLDSGVIQESQDLQRSGPESLGKEPATSTECPPLESEINDSSENVTEENKDDLAPSVPNLETEEVKADAQQNISVPEDKSTVVEPIKGVETANLDTSSPQVKSKLSKVERLRALGVDLSVKPLLKPDNGTFVNLEAPKPNKELEALKERFLKHTLHKASKTVTEKKVNLHIVRKETTADGKEELKAEVVPVTVDLENLEEKIHTKPGEKLQVLKAKLQEAMKLRRFEERQKRHALYKLDNEAVDDDEEEEEMTESEEEEDDNEEGGNAETLEYLLGDEVEEDDPKNGENSSIPDVRIPAPAESTLMLFKDNSTKIDDSIPDKIDGGCKENDKLGDDDDFLLPLTKDNSHNSSFELIGSMIPSYQPVGHSGRGSLQPSVGGFRSPSPVIFKANFVSSASKSSGKMSEPSLPVEDSQDLYNASPEPKGSYLCAGVNSQFQFSLEDDTQSQLLDADGFLNVGHNRSKYSTAKQRLVLDTMDENAMDANMGELLDLCSGKFKESQSNASQPNDNGVKNEAMDELLGLCSGKFVSQDECVSQDSVASANVQVEKEDLMSEAVALCSGSFTNRESEEQEDELGDFHLMPCGDSDSEQEVGLVSEEEEEEEEEEAASLDEDDEEEAILKRQSKKRKLKLQDFMEDEAELSGSDVGSEDEDDEEDEYEEEAIDEELPSDEELQDQLNKIHMKVTMDEDKRRLRLYQERYLADGDLHNDGPGRMRKFRWKNLDDASQFDMFRRDSDMEEQEGDNEEVDETEAKWRKERFEREQWLREQSKSGSHEKEEEEDLETDSQFMKLAKKVTEKTLQRKATVEIKEPGKTTCNNPFEVSQAFSLSKLKTGSMLNMSKDVLQKLATMSNLNPNAPRNSRNFVFQTLSPQKKDEPSEKPKAKVRKNIDLVTPSPKRFRSSSSTTANRKSRSIFPLLEN
ncbi:claspin [Gastrophryne carolinensis]